MSAVSCHPRHTEHPHLWSGLRFLSSPEFNADNTIRDLSPHDEQVTQFGLTASEMQRSQWGLAHNYNGTSSRITTTLTRTGTQARTVFAIVDVDTAGDRKFIASGNGATSGAGFAFTVENVLSSNRVLFRHGGGNIRYGSGLTGWFTFSAMVPDRVTTTDGVVVWINGTREAGTRNAGSNQTLATTSDPFSIGWDAKASGNYFDGRIGMVAIWDRELSYHELSVMHGNPLAIFQRMRMPLGFYPIVSSGVTITPASCNHAHTADAPAVTQTHQITAADATHSQTADSPTVSQTHVVAVAEATHAHAADSPAVTQTHVVAADDATHGHTADNVTVTVDAVSVTPADATHGHTADPATVTQTHVIVVAEATHGHIADSPAITQTHVISAASAIHSHTADNVTVTLSAAVAASQFWVCIGLEGWFSDRVGIEGWLAEALGLEGHVATAKGIE